MPPFSDPNHPRPPQGRHHRACPNLPSRRRFGRRPAGPGGGEGADGFGLGTSAGNGKVDDKVWLWKCGLTMESIR